MPSVSIAYTTAQGAEIRKLYKAYPEISQRIYKEVQFIGSHSDDIQALAFLRERINYSLLHEPEENEKEKENC